MRKKVYALAVSLMMVSAMQAAVLYHSVHRIVRIVALGLSVVMLSGGSASGAPEFSWDTIPRAIIFRDHDRTSDEAVTSIANNYPLVVLEKSNEQGFDYSEEGMSDVASRLKAVNPDIVNLAYWNSYYCWPSYEAGIEFYANYQSWSKDELATRGRMRLRHARSAMQEWWVRSALVLYNSPGIDGLFIDTLRSDAEPMVSELHRQLPSDAITMGNGTDLEAYWLDDFSGTYMEGWSGSADTIVYTIDTLRDHLARGITVFLRTGPGNTTNFFPDPKPTERADLLDWVERNVDFPLAVFLMIAEEQAYFRYADSVQTIDGEDSSHVWDNSYMDVFGKPLGAPLSDPVQSGYWYTRSFEHLDVSVNVESGDSSFQWYTPPTAYWPLDEGTGMVANDLSGNDYDGTITNGTWVTGVDGQALDFNGSTSKVTLPAAAFSEITNEVSIAMWVYGDTTQPRKDSVFCATDALGNHMLKIHLPWSDSRVIWDAGNDGVADRIEKVAEPSDFMGQWNHWVFTKNASTGEMSIYLNGSLWQTGTGNVKTMSSITAATLGSSISGHWYDGKVDDVRLYNVALDETEVAYLYNNNVAPLATTQSVVVPQDTATAITLAGFDAEGDSLTYAVVTSPTNGTLSGSVPNLTYTPDADYYGDDSFTYTVNDGTEDSPAVTLSIKVNTTPVATALTITLPEDGSTAVSLVASDVDGDSLAYSIVTAPTNGTLSGTAPDLTYTPNPDYNGFDSFTYTANDGTTNSATTTVSITVTAVDDAPIAGAQSVSANEDGSLAIMLTGSDVDGDSLTYAVVTAPTNGSLTGTAPNLTYTPNADYNGSDSFTFTANDGTTNSAAATVSITVTAVDDAPVAGAQSANVNEDGSLAIMLTGSDVDGDSLTYAVVTAPTNGTLSGTAPALTYTPNADYNGSDSFTYSVNDGTQDSLAATISITVTAVNDAPVFSADPITGADGMQNNAYSDSLSATDIDGDSLSYSVVSGPAWLTVASDGSLSGTPLAADIGSNSWTVEVSDENGGTNQAVLNVTVAVDPYTSALDWSGTSHMNVPYKTVDGQELNVDIYLPDTLEPSPVVIYTHGGGWGTGDSRNVGGGYMKIVAVDLLQAGIAVVSVNYRYASDGNTMQTCVIDSKDAYRFMSKHADTYNIDKTKMAAWGDSAGAHIAMMCAVTDNDQAEFIGDAELAAYNDYVIKGCVPWYGPVSFRPEEAYLWTEAGRSLGGFSNRIFGDETDPDIQAYEQNLVSPINYMHRTTVPVYMVHGVDDTTIPIFHVDLMQDRADTVGNAGFAFQKVQNAEHNFRQSGDLDINPKWQKLVEFTVNKLVSFMSISPKSDGIIRVTGAVNSTASGSSDWGTFAGTTFVADGADGTVGEGQDLIYEITDLNLDGDATADKVVIRFNVTAGGAIKTSSAGYLSSPGSILSSNGEWVQVQNAGVDVYLNGVLDEAVTAASGITELSVSLAGWRAGEAGTINGVRRTWTDNVERFASADNRTLSLEYESDSIGDWRFLDMDFTVGVNVELPTAIALSETIPEGASTSVTLAGLDAEGDTLSYTVVTTPANGTLTGTAPHLTYTPNSDYNGTDSFTYTVNDGAADSAVATVTITVTAVNDAPVADAKVVTTDEDIAVSVVLTGSDVDGDSLTYSVVTAPVNGMLSGIAPNLTYTPNSNYYGADGFTYVANDGSANSMEATVSITVNPVDDAPVYSEAPASSAAAVNGVYSDSLAASVIDVEGDSLTFSLVSGPSWLTVGVDGVLTGTPAPTDAGLNTWVIDVADAQGNVTAITLELNVVQEMLVAYDFNANAADLSEPTVHASYLGASPLTSPMSIGYVTTIGDNTGLDAYGALFGSASTLGAVGIDVDDATTNSFANAVAGDDYVSFTVTPDIGVGLELSALTFKAAKEADTSVDEYALADSGGNLIGSAVSITSLIGLNGAYEGVSIDLTNTPYAYINQATEFRIYAWGRGTSNVANTLAAIDKLAMHGSAFVAPVGYWPLDDGGSTTAVDSSGNGFDGAIANTTSVAGKVGTALSFNGVNSEILLPASAFATIDQQVTISMWVYGASNQPKNDSIFYAVDAAGNRVLNIHLPWNNSKVYWDAGWGGSGYDRINNAADASQYKGAWNHWVFVKNASTGTMEIYHNGVLFHSGTGKTKSMSGITGAALGSSVGGLFYSGSIDECVLFNVALTSEEVADLYNSY